LILFRCHRVRHRNRLYVRAEWRLLVVARFDEQVSSVGMTCDRRANVAPRCSNPASGGGALAGPLPGGRTSFSRPIRRAIVRGRRRAPTPSGAAAGGVRRSTQRGSTRRCRHW
jgi:hypothetical protein